MPIVTARNQLEREKLDWWEITDVRGRQRSEINSEEQGHQSRAVKARRPEVGEIGHLLMKGCKFQKSGRF